MRPRPVGGPRSDRERGQPAAPSGEREQVPKQENPSGGQLDPRASPEADSALETCPQLVQDEAGGENAENTCHLRRRSRREGAAAWPGQAVAAEVAGPGHQPPHRGWQKSGPGLGRSAPFSRKPKSPDVGIIGTCWQRVSGKMFEMPPAPS